MTAAVSTIPSPSAVLLSRFSPKKRTKIAASTMTWSRMSIDADSARLGSCASRRSSSTASPVTRPVVVLTATSCRTTDPVRASLGAVDIDAYVAAHQQTWDRLDALVSSRTLSPEQSDELVDLYRRVATHLSVVQSSAPDPVVVARLSSLVARARSVVTGRRVSRWREVRRFWTRTFPALVWRARWWAIGCAAGSLLVAAAVAVWVARNPDVQATLGTDADLRRLAEGEFEDYYSQGAAGSFAFGVWTNNAWIAAQCIMFGAFLGIPVIWVLLTNAVNLGLAAGVMAAYGRLDLFFGLILPHGLLELSAVFIAAGVGLRLGWTLIDPGPRRRVDAFAAEGRAALAAALGLGVVLLVSGVIEAFVTPSPLPTWARILIGATVWGTFVAYVVVLGRGAAAEGVATISPALLSTSSM